MLVQRRGDVPLWLSIAAPLVSVLLALLVGAAIIVASGKDPIMVYGTMFSSALTTRFGFSETLVKAIPLMLCGLAVLVTLRMKVLNLGAEGQLHMGAAAATWLATGYPHLPPGLMVPGMLVLGILAGGAWSILAILPRVLWGTSELITTLMFNYLAMLLVSFLVNGPWRDPAALGFALGYPYAPAARLPTLGTTRVHLGLIVAVLAAILLYVFMRRTRWGYEIEVIGLSNRAARYAGMNIQRSILLVTLISGALAGLAGMSEISGVVHRLQEGFSPYYGFSGIVVAALARYNPLAVPVVSLLFGALLVGGYTLQTVGVSANISQIIQGAVLLFVLMSDFFLNYRVRFVSTSRPGSAGSSRNTGPGASARAPHVLSEEGNRQ